MWNQPMWIRREKNFDLIYKLLATGTVQDIQKSIEKNTVSNHTHTEVKNITSEAATLSFFVLFYSHQNVFSIKRF